MLPTRRRIKGRVKRPNNRYWGIEMRNIRRSVAHGFTLIELIVVIVIIGILAAMAIPRMSRGAAGAGQTALIGDLAVIRNAINIFAEEHLGTFPSGPLAADVVNQLTLFTDEIGTGTSATKTTVFRFGPYLVKVPPCPVVPGANKSTIEIDSLNSPPATSASGKGWVYNPNTGEFIANSTATDDEGIAYNTY